MQIHVLYLQEQLHFEYVRLWNVFSTRMMISDGTDPYAFNYDLVNQVLDFLVQHKLKPFLDFGRRPNTAIRSGGDRIFYSDDYIPFQNSKIWKRAVSSMLQHIVDRYGQEEAAGWIYELSRGGFYGDHAGQLYEGHSFDFLDAWQYMYTEIHKIIPGAAFGGTRSEIVANRDEEQRFIQQCIDRNCVPDYFAYTVFPADELSGPEKNNISEKDRNSLTEEKTADQLRELFRETGLDERDVRLCVTEWNNSISNRNYINDSCYRAVYIVRTLSRIRQKVDNISIMCGSDWISSYVDTRGIVNGGIGLLTKDGIRKPAFFALEFLNQLGAELLSEADHWIATRKNRNNLYILCYHYTKYRRGYSLQKDVALDELRELSYEDDRPLRVKIRLDGIPQDGDYIVKRWTLNRGARQCPR